MSIYYRCSLLSGKESEKTSSNTKDVPIGKSPACAKADVSTIACVGPAISIMSAAGVGPGMSACGDKMSSVTGDGGLLPIAYA